MATVGLKHWRCLAPGIIAILILAPEPAVAEVPMATEAAETEREGGFEFAAQLFTDDEVRGVEIEFGHAPIENVEVELELELGRDRETSPASRLSEYGLSVKWVPEQSGEGISYGVAFAIGRETEDDRLGDKETGTEKSLMGVFSYDFHRGPHVHMNLGWVQEDEDDETETTFMYALGLEYRIGRRYTVTADVFGLSGEQADKQIGLRYKYNSGTNLFARVGHGNDRSFAGIGVAFEWEPD